MDEPAISRRAVVAGGAGLHSPDTTDHPDQAVADRPAFESRRAADRGNREAVRLPIGGSIEVNAGGPQLHCPCHGSIFNAFTGAVVQGPAPQPLPAFAAHLADGYALAG